MLSRFEAVWPIEDDLMQIDTAKAQALEELPDVAARHGHLWDETAPVTWSTHDGYKNRVGIWVGPVLVARTIVKTRTAVPA